jgi:hypothetical protein
MSVARYSVLAGVYHRRRAFIVTWSTMCGRGWTSNRSRSSKAYYEQPADMPNLGGFFLRTPVGIVNALISKDEAEDVNETI